MVEKEVVEVVMVDQINNEMKIISTTIIEGSQASGSRGRGYFHVPRFTLTKLESLVFC